MTTNPRKYYKSNCNTEKIAPSYNQKDAISRRNRAKTAIFSNST